MTGVTKPSAASRSCTLCHQRKVRCDKRYPCANCSRAGAACSYPSSNAPVSRRPKSTIADIAGRLQQLEKTIVSLSSPSATPSTSDTLVVHNSSTATSTRATSSSTSQAQQGPSSNHVRREESTTGSSYISPPESRRGEFRGVLVNSGQYVNEILLSRVLEEEEETQSSTSSRSEPPPSGPPTALTTPIGYPFSPSTTTPPHDNTTTVSNPMLDLLPTRSQVSRLWSSFTIGSQTLMDLLHLPTTQLTIFSAIDNPSSAGADALALLYAMSFFSLTIMWPDEARVVMSGGCDGTISKPESLTRMKTGFEASLASANIMEHPTVVGLQSMALFLQAIRCHRVSRSDWVFLGLAIRLAQSIGVHRDGRHFPKLTVFEKEVRRRLWWQLHAHDVRAAEDHGFAAGTGDDTSSYGADADVPLHVDDGALYPGMKELPVAKEGFTKMTHGLIMIKGSEACKGLSRALGSGGGEKERRRVVREMNDSVREMMGWFSPVVPDQRACLVGCQIVLGKRDFVSRVQLLSRHGPHEDEEASGGEGERDEAADTGAREGSSGPLSHDTPRRRRLMEESLVIACDLLDLEHQFCEDEVLRVHIWVAEAYPQYHLLLYVLWHLTVRPDGPTVERAWRSVQKSFDHEAMRAWRQGSGEEPFNPKNHKPTGHKWVMFTKLRDKALRAKAGYEVKVNGRDSFAAVVSKDLEVSGKAMVGVGQDDTGDNSDHGGMETVVVGGQYPPMDDIQYEAVAPEFLHGQAEVDDWNALLAEFTAAQDFPF